MDWQQRWDERYSGTEFEIPTQPSQLHTPESIAAELAGLRVLRADRVRRTVARDGATATAIDTLVRAERTRPALRTPTR